MAGHAWGSVPSFDQLLLRAISGSFPGASPEVGGTAGRALKDANGPEAEGRTWHV